jgi:putative PIN family toxin of toxin-antitoxin system
MSKIFVFDTNNLISAHLLPNSINRKAFDLAFEKGILVCSRATFSEFTEVFTRPKFDRYISLDNRLEAIDTLESKLVLIDVISQVRACRDPKDDQFLSLAIDSKADIILSGDPDLLVLHPFHGIPILNPTDFVDWIQNKGGL